MMDKNLLLVGGGEHCKCVIDIAEALGYNILGVLDVAENIGKKVLGYDIVGTDDCIHQYVEKAKFLVTVGQIKSPEVRIRLQKKVIHSNGKLATLIAPTAYVSKYAEIGDGSIVMHKAFVDVGAKIGSGCIINTMANIAHNVTIGNFCHISTGVMVNGDSSVGDNAFIGSQAVVNNQITIAEDCFFAAGTVIQKNITVAGIYAGNPAKLKIRKEDVPNYYYR